jgi:hypothetical protein
MLKRRLLLFCVFNLSFLFVCAVRTAGENNPAPPAPDGAAEMNWTRRPVMFSHERHFTANNVAADNPRGCILCHHPVQGKIPYKPCAASGCHDNMRSKAVDADAYYQATHKEEKGTCDSCVSCHTRVAGTDLEKLKQFAGCNESVCHP